MSQFFHIFVQQVISLRILCMFFGIVSVEQLLQFLFVQELISKIKQWLVTNVGPVEAIMNGCLRKKMQPFWMTFWMVGQTFDGQIATEGARHFGDMSMFWDRFSFAGMLIFFAGSALLELLTCFSFLLWFFASTRVSMTGCSSTQFTDKTFVFRLPSETEHRMKGFPLFSLPRLRCPMLLEFVPKSNCTLWCLCASFMST